MKAKLTSYFAPFLCLLLALTVGTASLRGQNENPFANLQGWEMVSTENFDVYFPSLHRGGAIQTARFAELARYELGVLLDYKPTSHFTLIYADDAMTLLHSNLQFQEADRVPSIFELPRRYATVVHPGSNQELYQAVRRAVGEVILKEFSFGERLGSTLQTKLLLYDAPWFHQGLAEYVSAGWTFEDEMWINSLAPADLLELAMEDDAPLNRSVRKSVWHYITHEYGEQKISEIIYLVNISHSIESGIISVLGINLNTLTRRWRDFLSLRAERQESGRMNIQAVAKAIEVPIPSGQELLNYAYYPEKDLVALYLNNRGKQQVMIYDLSSRQFESTPIRSGFQRQDAESFSFSTPMTWDTTKQVLITVAYRKAEPELVYYSVPTGEISYYKLDKNIHKVLGLAVSPDGQRLAVSALKSGRIDLFLTPTGSAQLNAITADPYDNLDPRWTQNGTLLFSSNRDTTALDITEIATNTYLRHFDVYEMIWGEATSFLSRLTRTPLISERTPSIGVDGMLTYLSDEYGLLNLAKRSISRGGTSPFTNFSQGVLSYQQMDRFTALSMPIAGETHLFVAPSIALQTLTEPQPTLLRLEYLAAYEARMKQESKREEIALAELAEKAAAETEAETQEPTPVAEPEEPKTEEPARYYIFDDEEITYEPPSPEKQRRDQIAEENRVMITVFGRKAAPELSEIEVSKAQKAKNPWLIHQLGIGLQFDPLARLGPEFTIGARDLMDNHRVSLRLWPSFSLRNVENTLNYEYRKHRLDIFAEIGQQTRRVRETSSIQIDSLFFRYDRLHLKGGVAYPFNAFAQARVFGGLYQVSRKDLQLLRTELQDASDQLAQAGVQVEVDRVEEREGFAYKGLYAQAGFESFYSFQQKGIVLSRARLELKHYQQVAGKMVLATRMASTINLPKSLRQYYMGDTDRRLGRAVVLQNPERNSRIQNQVSDTSLYTVPFIEFITPVRGFLPNTRNGSRYVVANLELRIPLSYLSKRALPAKYLHHFEIIPFVDAGTVWVDGNPFSQKKPTDTQFIPNGPITVTLQTLKSPFLIGFGSGVRTNVLGWSLRLDVAWGLDDYTLQRPILTASVAKNF